MPGVGVGGLFANLFNPGLDDRLAQHITPNPNPLAQQGGPAAPGSVDALGNPSPSKPPPGSNLAPAAVTQPDPANAANIAALTQPSNAYAADALRAHRMDALSADLNQNLAGRRGGLRHRAATGFQAGRAPRRRRRSRGFARGPQRHPRAAGHHDHRQRACPLHGQRSYLRSDLVAVAWPARV